MVTLTWHASKYRVHKLLQGYLKFALIWPKCWGVFKASYLFWRTCRKTQQCGRWSELWLDHFSFLSAGREHCHNAARRAGDPGGDESSLAGWRCTELRSWPGVHASPDRWQQRAGDRGQAGPALHHQHGQNAAVGPGHEVSAVMRCFRKSRPWAALAGWSPSPLQGAHSLLLLVKLV